MMVPVMFGAKVAFGRPPFVLVRRIVLLPEDIVIQYYYLAVRTSNILQLIGNIETPYSIKGPISILIIAMNMEKIIMHHTGMENPQVIIAFPVTVRTLHW